jgi:hypothetical protein
MHLAKFKSSGATKINPIRSERFQKLYGQQVPGPGEYDPKLKTTKDGFQYIQKFHSSGARSHYHFDRTTLPNSSTARFTPGPGSYKAPSDFGFYESKHAKKRASTARNHKRN